MLRRRLSAGAVQAQEGFLGFGREVFSLCRKLMYYMRHGADTEKQVLHPLLSKFANFASIFNDIYTDHNQPNAMRYRRDLYPILPMRK